MEKNLQKKNSANFSGLFLSRKTVENTEKLTEKEKDTEETFTEKEKDTAKCTK